EQSAAPAAVLPSVVETDEVAARRSLRDQIAKLERELAAAFLAAYPRAHADWSVPGRGGPRLLGLGELERLRDDLAERLRGARAAAAAAGWPALAARGRAGGALGPVPAGGTLRPARVGPRRARLRAGRPARIHPARVRDGARLPGGPRALDPRALRGLSLALQRPGRGGRRGVRSRAVARARPAGGDPPDRRCHIRRRLLRLPRGVPAPLGRLRLPVTGGPAPAPEPPRMRLRGLHHVTLISRDLVRTTSFYRDVLGLALVQEGVNDDDPDARH